MQTSHVEGFRDPQWVVVPLKDADLPAIADAVRDLHARLEPARPRRILEIMFQVIERYRQHEKQRTAASWEALAHEYVADLGQFSEAHILEALVEYRRGNKWFPHQSELIAICEGLVGKDRMLRRRGQVLLGQREPYPWERPPALVDDSQQVPVEKIRSVLEDMAKHKPVIPLPVIKLPEREARPTVAEMNASRDPAAVEKLRALKKDEKV